MLTGGINQRSLKRTIDLVGSALLLILFAPLILLIAFALMVRNGPPVIHRESRYGLRGRPFTMYKFRTLRMGTGAEQTIAAEGDERIEPLGQFLRRWRLDEFPQLINILRGEMSLVGPRPLPAAQAHFVPEQVLVELGTFAPGLTGSASVLFLADDAVLARRSDAEQLYLETILPAKLATELDYVRQWTLMSDLRILWRTVRSVWSHRAREESRRRVLQLLH